MRSDLKKTRLLHLGNVEKPPHPQFSAQRAPGLTISCNRKISTIAYDQDKKGIIMPINTIFRESRLNQEGLQVRSNMRDTFWKNLRF